MSNVNTTVYLKIVADWKDPYQATVKPLSNDVCSRIVLHHVRMIPGTGQRLFSHRFLEKGCSLLECAARNYGSLVTLSHQYLWTEHFQPLDEPSPELKMLWRQTGIIPSTTARCALK